MRYALFMICLVMASCITPAKFQDWAQRHPAESARICSDLYPVQTDYRTGKDSVRYEAVQLAIPGGLVGLYLPVYPAQDSMHYQDKQGNLTADAIYTGNGWQVQCTADSLQLLLDSAREIHHQVDTAFQESTAHVRALQADSTQFVQQVNKALTRGDAWQKWALYTAGGLVLACGWIFRVPILGVIKKLIV